MRTSVTGVLAVDERCDVLTIAVAMGDPDLDVFSGNMDRGLERVFRPLLIDEVEETVLGNIWRTVEVEGQSLLQV